MQSLLLEATGNTSENHCNTRSLIETEDDLFLGEFSGTIY